MPIAALRRGSYDDELRCLDVSEPGSPTAPTHDPDIPEEGGRSLPIWGFVALAALQQVILKVVRAVATSDLDTEYATYADAETVWRALVIPVGVSSIFTAAAVTILGWWPTVIRDHRPVQRWVRIVPITLVVAIAIGTAYADLFDQTAGYIALLVLGVLLVGFSEETMYRGLGVTAFRAKGFPEARVALWTSVLFGLAHASNIIEGGAKHIPQVFLTMVGGYLFYLCLRVTGSLVVSMVLHAFWDFVFFTGNITDDTYPGSVVVFLVVIVVPIILLVRRHSIEPESSPAGV